LQVDVRTRQFYSCFQFKSPKFQLLYALLFLFIFKYIANSWKVSYFWRSKH